MSATTFQNLFITRLPRSFTDENLSHLFEAYHPLSAKIMVDPNTGFSKGFGFIYFKSDKEGKAAFDAMNGTRHECPERQFSVIMQPSLHNGRIAAAESCALYVRNIPLSTPKAEVEAKFRPFGTITSFAMRQDYHGNAVWVVYVEYETVESAKAALHAVHQKWTPGLETNSPATPVIAAKFADTEELKRERRRHRSAASSLTTSPQKRREETAPYGCLNVSQELDSGNSFPGNVKFQPLAVDPLHDINSTNEQASSENSLPNFVEPEAENSSSRVFSNTPAPGPASSVSISPSTYTHNPYAWR